MDQKITYYALDEILAAAESFATNKQANEHLNRALRSAEAKKQNITQKNVREISHETLCEVMASLTGCPEDVILAIKERFTRLGYKVIEKEAGVRSHFAFGEHWNELPKYAGYTPTQYTNWQSIKEQFYTSEHYNHEKPLPMNITKEGNSIVVNLYGFKIPEAPPVVALGTSAAIIGRVALCKTITKNEYIAIAW